MGQGIGNLLQVFRAHAAQDIGRFRELNIFVGHDFYAVAPRVAKVKPTVEQFDAEFGEGCLNRLPVVAELKFLNELKCKRM